VRFLSVVAVRAGFASSPDPTTQNGQRQRSGSCAHNNMVAPLGRRDFSFLFAVEE
jgi:hypothetical protein